MADTAALFKLTTKAIAIRHNITATFMAKPFDHLPGTSGHMHISLWSRGQGQSRNLFSDHQLDPEDAKANDNLMGWFLAGILKGTPSIQAILCPNINRYSIHGYHPLSSRICYTSVTSDWCLENTHPLTSRGG